MKMNTVLCVLGTLGALVLMASVGRVDSAAFIFECPDDREDFEFWRPDETVCESCVCLGAYPGSDMRFADCVTCSPQYYEDGWTLTQNLTLPYPDCCPHWSPPPQPEIPPELIKLIETAAKKRRK